MTQRLDTRVSARFLARGKATLARQARVRILAPLARSAEKALDRTVFSSNPFVRKGLTACLRAFRCRLLLIEKGLRLSTWSVVGTDGRGTQRRLFYAGEQEALKWFASLVLPGGFVEEPLQPVGFRGLRKLVEERRADHDLVALEVNRLLLPWAAAGGALRSIPRWVRMKLPLAATWEEMQRQLRKSALTQVRAVRNREFSSDTTRDPAAFQEFHEQLYLPFVQTRYGEDSIPARRKDLERYFRSGWLLRIFEKGDWVAGALLTASRTHGRCVVLGVRGGDPGLIARHALKAVYCFMVRWAIDLKLVELDVGRVRPLLEDGVFRHKRGWGGVVSADPWEEAKLLVAGGRDTSFLNEWSDRHSVIEDRDGRLVGRVRLPCPLPIDAEALENLRHRFSTPGLDSVEIVGSDNAVGMLPCAEESRSSDRAVIST